MTASFVPLNPTTDLHSTTRQLDIPKPVSQPETMMSRSLKKIYKTSFKQDPTQSSYIPRSLISIHSSAAFLTNTLHSAAAQPVDGNWLSGSAVSQSNLANWNGNVEGLRDGGSKLTVQKQIYKSIKREVTDLMGNAKTALFSSKIPASKTCKKNCIWCKTLTSF